VYALVMRLDRRRRIRIGGLGPCDFEPGWYVYAGSARGAGGIRARVARHLREDGRDKPRHWHIDYLRAAARVVDVWTCTDPAVSEHDVTRALLGEPGAAVPVAGFGAHDCRAGCPAHLVRLRGSPRRGLMRLGPG
jgi:Uri superfamily endonuclease